MTLSKEEKFNLINYRLSQAKDTANVAHDLVKLNKLPTAVNRIYYAIFYSLLALAVKYEFETSKHLQLLGWFNKNFIATGKIEPEFGSIARKSYEYRRAADYDAFVKIEYDQVEILLIRMDKFLVRIKELLA